MAPASAQESGLYADIGYQFAAIEEDEIQADVGVLTAHLGYNVNSVFAVEGEVGVGVRAEDIGIAMNTNAEIGVDHIFGVYARFQAPISETFKVFARAGLVNVQVGVQVGEESEEDFADRAENGAAYGLGAEYHFYRGNGFRLDYTRYEFGNLETDTLMIGYSRKF